MRRVLICLLAMALLATEPLPPLVNEERFETVQGIFLAAGEAPVITATSYRSHNIYIDIISRRFMETDVYVADVHVRSMDNFRRIYAGGEWDTRRDRVDSMSEASGAILAMTGDSSEYFSSGWVAGNGVIWRDIFNTKRDLCILYKDGRMVTYKAPSRAMHRQFAEEKDDIWQTFLFGPALLDEEGKAYTKFNSNVKVANPRSVIGYYEPGHYCFVQVDGRSTDSVLEEGEINNGLSLVNLAQLMESLGCKAAYNLDGGRSSMMWFVDGIISTPAAINRTIGDIVAIMETE